MSSVDLRTGDRRRDFAREVVERLRGAGFVALWAGGCVRDLVLGHEPTDYDVATDATPEAVMKLFRRTVPVGISFGVVRVLGPRDAGEVEVATFRSDGRYVDGRRPESVQYGRPEEDASRRDFTINGMFLDPISGDVIDYVGGRADLDAGVVRAIGVARDRFLEDKLRLIRAVRFAARFGFRIEPSTFDAVVSLAPEVGVVAAERIAQELRKMVVDRSRAEAARLLAETGLLGEILPEVDSLRFADGGESWDLTLRTLTTLGDDPTPSFPLAFAILLMDVARGEVGESAVGRVQGIAERLRLSNAERERVTWLVGNQDALTDLERAARASRRKRLLGEPGIEDLIRISEARCRAEGRSASAAEFARDYLTRLPEGPLNPPPLMGGRDLHALGVPQGPEFRVLLEAVREEQLNGTLLTRDDAIAWVTQQMRDR